MEPAFLLPLVSRTKLCLLLGDREGFVQHYRYYDILNGYMVRGYIDIKLLMLYRPEAYLRNKDTK